MEKLSLGIRAVRLAVAAALLAAAPARAAENRWPGTKASEPTPRAQGVPK